MPMTFWNIYQLPIRKLSTGYLKHLKKFKTPEKKEIINSESSILDYLNHDGVYVDEIIRESGLSASEVAAALLDLELDGRIERICGNKVALIK